MDKIKNHTVVFLFDEDTKCVLLQLKDRGPFIGKLNGVGGKFEEGETALQCMLREVEEETGVTDIRGIHWLGQLILPNDEPDGPKIGLDFFCGKIYGRNVNPPKDAEIVSFYQPQQILEAGADQPNLAGSGDVWYFLRMACQHYGYAD